MVFGINIAEPTAVVADFIQQFQLTFPVLLGDDDTYASYYLGGNQVSPFPRDFIIGRDGLIAYTGSEYNPALMIEVIENELNLTGIAGEAPQQIPSAVELTSTYPNPVSVSSGGFSGRKVNISYKVNLHTQVHIRIFDVTGRLIRDLSNGLQLPGQHETQWDGRDQNSDLVSSGVYFLQLKTPAGQLVSKLNLIR